ncbi:MAG TPA: class I adenylate-forming enzyme family protein [Stellaceae bacterium]|nr:class I adenylate-forming enzyme family protein [Stellaceae bacterium]
MFQPVNLGDLVDPAGDQSKIALIDLLRDESPREYSYAEIDAVARGVARLLTARGFAKGSRIAILSLNRAEYVATYFGIMRAGLVAVPVNAKLPAATVAYIIEDAEIELAFADRERAGLVRPGLPVIGFDDDGPEGFAAQLDPGPFATHVPRSDEIGQQLYTSGSTGRPKGVPLSHAGQIWALAQRGGQPGMEHERSIVAAPLFHMNGLFSTKLAFFNRASMVLLPSFTAASYIAAVARYRVTGLTSVPTMLARVAKERELLARVDLSCVRRVTMGSAPLSEGLIERVRQVFPGAAVMNAYGTTEAGPAVFGAHPASIATPPLSLGYPLPGADVRLVGGPSPEEGVLQMRNPSLMAGYHNLPEQTAKALVDGWYHSGDVCRRDENGFYYFVGRADDMFVCSGENIYPGEVEKQLEQHPAIHQASVVPLPDEERGQVPVAFIVLRPGEELDYAAVKRFAIAGGPAYQHPRRVAFVAELPWAGTNKIDRKALLEEARQREAEGGWAT